MRGPLGEDGRARLAGADGAGGRRRHRLRLRRARRAGRGAGPGRGPRAAPRDGHPVRPLRPRVRQPRADGGPARPRRRGRGHRHGRRRREADGLGPRRHPGHPPPPTAPAGSWTGPSTTSSIPGCGRRSPSWPDSSRVRWRWRSSRPLRSTVDQIDPLDKTRPIAHLTFDGVAVSAGPGATRRDRGRDPGAGGGHRGHRHRDPRHAARPSSRSPSSTPRTGSSSGSRSAASRP